MIHFAEILQANPNGVLATQGNGKIKTRVFQYLFADGSKVYFCTSSQNPVYDQFKENPNVSFCTYPENFTPVLSISGEAVFVEDMALKTRALDENHAIKGICNTPDNPIFKIFYIDVEEVETFSFAEGSKTIKFNYKFRKGAVYTCRLPLSRQRKVENIVDSQVSKHRLCFPSTPILYQTVQPLPIMPQRTTAVTLNE